ncbi:FAD-dependent oxidoreductase [bacterium]|nr:FAD-dependent oxidoreductase [bacterium]
MTTSTEVVKKLSEMRGAIPLPASMTRRGFLAAAGVSAAAIAAAESRSAASAAEGPAAGAAAGAAKSADGAGSATGMTFSGNAGKTMGEVLGAGWLGEEPAIASSDIAETVDTQIVICGAGHAGTACARKAAELGAKVLVLEAQPEDGFTVLGNDIGHLNSAWQTELMGVPHYDETEFMNEYQIYCAGRAEPKLIRDFAYRSGEAFDWFIDNFTDEEKRGIVCLNWPVADGYDYKKGIFTSYVGTPNFGEGVSLQEALLRTQKIAQQAGAEFRFGTTAVRLVHNDDGTEVTGVIAQAADGSYLQVNAQAVVLACGDIGSNSQMYNAICAENYALGEYKDCMAFSGRDGSGIAMGMRIGAKCEIGTGGDMGSHASFPLGPMEGAETIWLNKYGKRYCNEAYGGPLLSGCATARQPGDIIYSIWDADWKTVLLNQIAGHLALKDWREESIDKIGSYMEAAIGSGADGDDTSGKYLYCADTLDELFEYMGMEEGVAANAKAEIEAWNAAHDAGVDTEFGRDPSMLWPIVTPPFYGFVGSKHIGGGSLVATSGLLVTGDQQVQGQGFEPIKGLYATGNNSGGRFPMGYNGIMNGVSIGQALTQGMVLGEFLATADLDEATTLGKGNAEPKQSANGMGPGGPAPAAGGAAGPADSAAGEGAPAGK